MLSIRPIFSSCSRIPFGEVYVLSSSLLPIYLPEPRFSHLRSSLKTAWARLRVHSRYYSSCDVEKNPGPSSLKNSAKNSLKIIHLNIRSLICHFDKLLCFVSSNRPDVLALSETWLDSSISDSEISLQGYSIFRSDRSRSGGGVAVYVADQFASSCLPSHPYSSGLESLWLSINNSKFPSSLVLDVSIAPLVPLRNLCLTLCIAPNL